MTVRITWWGHATTTIELDGTRILTDPLLSGRLAHLRRIGGPDPAPDVLQADAVLISHLHGDHLHLPSLRRLAPTIRIIAPRGTARLVARAAPRLSDQLEEIELDGEITVGAVTIRAVDAAHDPKRLPLSRHTAPALGFVLSRLSRLDRQSGPGGPDGPDQDGPPETVWFAGDTGLFDAMSDIGPVQVAIVPVGGWGPTLGEEHLDPARAAAAVRRVGARDAVPIHFGTFWPMGLRRVQPAVYEKLFLSPGRRFVDELARACPDARAHLLQAGDSIQVQP
jgi:L-ascorbate metabolism protein UlaG (beta-lactamase superfamily)